MSRTQITPGAEYGVRSTTQYWWIALGSVTTGISVANLAVTYFNLGVTGFVALVLEQYSRLKASIFGNLETLIPALHLTDTERGTVLSGLIFFAVCVRAVAVAKKQSSVDSLTFGVALVSALQVLLMLSLLYSLIAALVIGGISGSPRWFALAALACVIVACSFALWAITSVLVGDQEFRVSIEQFVINAVACASVATLLLALGGAF